MEGLFQRPDLPGLCLQSGRDVHGATNASSGYGARNEATGEKSVIAAAGLNSEARGAKGTAIALPYTDSKGQIRFATGVIGEKGLKADTWYRAENGKLVEA